MVFERISDIISIHYFRDNYFLSDGVHIFLGFTYRFAVSSNIQHITLLVAYIILIFFERIEGDLFKVDMSHILGTNIIEVNSHTIMIVFLRSF